MISHFNHWTEYMDKMKDLEKQVQEMYEQYPYPSIAVYSNSYDIKVHANHILRSLKMKTTDFNSNQKILDAGCGTGEITCSLAFSGAQTLGIDFSENSLKHAKLLAEKYSLKNIKFKKQNLLNLNLPEKEKFDFVFAIGSLHHTVNPKKAFANLAKHVKPNGFITLGLYNFFGRFSHRLRRKTISLLAGKSFEEKISLAEKLFPDKGKIKVHEKIYLADKYANPNEQYSSLEEVFSWFEEFGFEFYNSYPKIEFNSLFLTQLKWFAQQKTFFFVSGKKSE